MKTRHYGIMSIAALSIGQGLAHLCGQGQFTDALSTGNYSVIALTVADYIIARIKNAKGNLTA